ncbi:MAG: AAA family ATPase, partial [Burkholderiales bacterium]
MFLDFYHLRAQPFGFTPDPQFLYLGSSHAEALASLYCGIEADSGITVLIAPPGLGKTPLLNRLLDHYHNSARTRFHFDAPHDSCLFLRFIAHDLGISAEVIEGALLFERLKHTFLEIHRDGRLILLAINEAQNLDESVFETLRLL